MMLIVQFRSRMVYFTIRETEAEAIAFVVSQSIGLDAGNSACDYFHVYNGDAALLTESLEVPQPTSALILAAIEPPTAYRGEKALQGRANLLAVWIRTLGLLSTHPALLACLG
jgi:hypothetical protein